MAKFVNWIQMIVIKEGVRDESKKWMAAIAFVMFISGTFIQEAFAETWKQGMNGDLSVC